MPANHLLTGHRTRELSDENGATASEPDPSATSRWNAVADTRAECPIKRPVSSTHSADLARPGGTEYATDASGPFATGHGLGETAARAVV